MMHSFRAGRLLLATAALAVAASTACAQQTAARTPSAVEVDSMLARAQRARLKGAENAPVTLIEVSDFQCPYCRQFSETTYPQLDSVYVRTGRVRLVYINYPLPTHRQAFAAAEAATCAGAQGQFWAMHDRLFATQREWNGQPDATQRFEAYAAALRLNMAAFRDCTANDRTAPMIIGDIADAAAGGVNGTPAFFLAGPGGRKPLNGAVPWEQLRTEIEAVLTAPPAGAAPPQP